MSDQTLLLALASATPTSRAAALRLLRGEPEEERRRGPLLSLSGLAKALGVSRSTLYRSGTLPAFVLGNTRRYDPEEVKEHLRKLGEGK